MSRESSAIINQALDNNTDGVTDKAKLRRIQAKNIQKAYTQQWLMAQPLYTVYIDSVEKDLEKEIFMKAKYKLLISIKNQINTFRCFSEEQLVIRDAVKKWIEEKINDIKPLL